MSFGVFFEDFNKLCARYNMSRACFPRMGTASMRKCKSLFSG